MTHRLPTHRGFVPLVAALVMALMLPLLAGCESGLRIGSWQVIPPQASLSSTGVQIARTQPTAAAALSAKAAKAASTQPATQPALLLNQKLVIDFNTGHALFTDTDGRLYPHRLSPDAIRQLRDAIAGRTWQVGQLDPADAAVNPMRFTLTVHDGDAVLPDQAIWTSQSKKQVPDSLKLFEDALDRAHRLAHPLSETVDLLK